ncbi:MAG: recombinase family protein [Selenomonadaceae bacterium]|nr:recombinase family protein [Selenomonadaceae bacterium]
MRYGYARVSTRKQVRENNGLKAQIELLKKNDCEKIVQEEITGKTNTRPKLNWLLGQLTEGDTLVVTKLDRLARSVREGAALIEDLFNRGVTVYILDIGTLDNTPTGKLVMHIFLAIAEFERTLILERTNLGKEVARTKAGYREGRRPIDALKKRDAADLFLFHGKTYKEILNLTGLSSATLTRAVRARKDELAAREIEAQKNKPRK